MSTSAGTASSASSTVEKLLGSERETPATSSRSSAAFTASATALPVQPVTPATQTRRGTAAAYLRIGDDRRVSERADVVVIGGGVMGAAALRYLTELGCPRPLLLERETLASGSTGRCAGGVRTLFSDELNVRIGLESIQRLQRFEEEVGERLDLRLDGYLFLLDDAGDLERFEADLVHQAAAGIETRILTRDEARELVPQLAVDDLCGAVFNAVAGLVTPDLVVQGCARHAVRLGARVEQSCAVERIVVKGGRVIGVETRRGRIDTDCVILTAGVWSRELAATAGFDLLVEPKRRFMHVTGGAPDFPERLPLTIDFSTSFYFHREGEGILFGGREQSLDELAPHDVGLLRDEPRPQRADRRGARAGRACLRDRLLRPWVPAGARRGRAPCGAGARERADVRPLAIRRAAVHAWDGPRRAERHLTGMHGRQLPGSRLGVVPKNIVHPGLPGGWSCQQPAPKEARDEGPR